MGMPTDILRAFMQYHCRQFLVRRQFWFINMYSLYTNFYRHNAIRHKRPSYCRQSLHKMSAGIYIYIYIYIFLRKLHQRIIRYTMKNVVSVSSKKTDWYEISVL